MFEFLRRKKKKAIIVAIHGFGQRRSDQFLSLVRYFKDKGIEVRTPDLFDANDLNDTDYLEWIKRAEIVVDQALHENKEVILLGYSMGGVIASSLASRKPISKLILLAPAFTYITWKNVSNTVAKLFDSNTPKIEALPSQYTELPNIFTNTFMTLVDTLKNDITQVSCPILIFHGMDDETIPYASSRRILQKINHKNRALILLNEVGHKLLDNDLNYKIILETTHSFIENKL